MQASVLLGLCLALLQTGTVQNETPSTPGIPTRTTQVRSISNHFQKNNLTVTLDDPMTPPNATKFIDQSQFDFYNLTIHGLSSYTVEVFTAFLHKMKVSIWIRMEKIPVDGIFEKKALHTPIIGILNTTFKPMIVPFNVTFKSVTAHSAISLAVKLNVDSTRKVFAAELSTELSYEDIEVFTEAKPGSMDYSVLERIGMNLFPLIKPLILGQIDKRLIEYMEAIRIKPEIFDN